MKKKLLLIFFLCVVLAFPAFAVFNEKNISQTISILRQEMHIALQELTSQESRQEKMSNMAELQHRDMLNTIKWINELTLILYSQEKDFTLDQTYAMEGVMGEYKKFNKRRHPQLSNIGTIDAEIERYQRLIESLRLLPPKLYTLEDVPDTLRHDSDSLYRMIENINVSIDSTTASPVLENASAALSSPADNSVGNVLRELAFYGIDSKKEAAVASNEVGFMLPLSAQKDRDSCISCARAIILSYEREKARIREEEYYFSEMNSRLQQDYEYSKSRFEEIQKYIFVSGQENYLYVLSHFGKYAADAIADMQQKYGSGEVRADVSELRGSQWRGFGLAGTLLYTLWHLLLITLAVVLLSCVILKKRKPFNTEAFKQTRPVVIALAVAVIYSLQIMVSICFPMSNSMMLVAGLALVYLWFVIALLLSILIDLKNEDVATGFKVFQPVLVMGLMVILCRSLFLPDKMIHLLLLPVMAAFFIWQVCAIRQFKEKCKAYKMINCLLYVTAVVFGLSILSALEGYSLFALMLIMWWIFQLSAFTTLTSIAHILHYYEKNCLARKKERYVQIHNMVSKDEDGDYIRVTWLFDFVKRVLVPVAGIFSILGCIWLAFGVFNLTETCNIIFHEPFLDLKDSDGSPVLQITMFRLAMVISYYFLFRYLNYLARSLYRANKLEKVMVASGNDFIRKNDVNLTLAYNVIGILIWGLFVMYSIDILKIPLGAISIVAAGLATGIGLALKDVLNNFIYGIQLMSGRLRVGDMLECDGIRGTVEKISYQSTEIQTLTGGVISFTNSTLFNKNFQNLTRNSPYEFVSIVVSISYGEDIDKVRHLISEAMNEYSRKKDKYGRRLVERKAGIYVTVDEFCDSAINISINQNVLVDSTSSYVAEVKELIYKLFNNEGISMPFPQQEVTLLNFPQNGKLNG